MAAEILCCTEFATEDLSFTRNDGVMVPISNTATITANRLVMAGAGEYIRYHGTKNFDGMIQTFSIQFEIIPTYTGIPGATKVFFGGSENTASSKNLIQLRHLTGTGNIGLEVNSSAGAAIINVQSAAWLPVSGTSYVFKVAVDVTTGVSSVWIDNIRILTDASTGTRDQNMDNFFIGAGYNAGSVFQAGSIGYFLVYDTVRWSGDPLYDPIEDTCVVWGKTKGVDGDVDTTPVTVKLNRNSVCYKSEVRIVNSLETDTPDSNGIWSFELIESENMSDDAKYIFNIGGSDIVRDVVDCYACRFCNLT